MKSFLKQQSEKNKKIQKEKRFQRYVDLRDGKKIKLDLTDRLNLMTTGKC